MSANFATSSFEDILDDLSSRFIINVPEEELASIERICFQIEQAHWFYEDFVREENPSLPAFSLRAFTSRFFEHCPLLKKWEHEHEKAFETFIKYKVRVPVCGAIMLNADLDKCVLVKGWSAKSGWGFPKGKINKDESQFNCAAREVLEETGFDMRPYINETDYIQVTLREQCVRLYIAPNVPEDTQFQCQTRKEIRAIEWHLLADLPGYSKSNNPSAKNASRYYMVLPFMSKLQQWVRNRKRTMKGLAAEPVLSDADFVGVRDQRERMDTMVDAASSSALKSLLGLQNGALLDELSFRTFPNDSQSAMLKGIIGVGMEWSHRTESANPTDSGLLKEMIGVGNSHLHVDGVPGATFTSTAAVGSGILREAAGAQAPIGGADFGVTLQHQAQRALESPEMWNGVERTGYNGASGAPTRGQVLTSTEELKQMIGISRRQPDRAVEDVRPGDVAAAENLKRLLGVSGPAEVLPGVVTPGTDLPYVNGGIGAAPLRTPLLGFRFDVGRVLEALG